MVYWSNGCLIANGNETIYQVIHRRGLVQQTQMKWPLVTFALLGILFPAIDAPLWRTKYWAALLLPLFLCLRCRWLGYHKHNIWKTMQGRPWPPEVNRLYRVGSCHEPCNPQFSSLCTDSVHSESCIIQIAKYNTMLVWEMYWKRLLSILDDSMSWHRCTLHSAPFRKKLMLCTTVSVRFWL